MTKPMTVMGDPDFAALAEGYGAVGLRVARTEEWPAALAAALAADRPALIHVTCDAADIVPYGPGKDAKKPAPTRCPAFSCCR